MKRLLLCTFICITSTIQTNNNAPTTETTALLMPDTPDNQQPDQPTPPFIQVETEDPDREHHQILTRETECRWVAGAFGTFLAITFIVGAILEFTLQHA